MVSPQLGNHCPAGYFKDVFNYLVEGKGRKINNYTMLEKGDFRRCAFPSEWDQLVDKLGDGIKIDFPVKVRLFISQGPKSHTMTAGEIKEYPRSSVYTVSNKLSVLLILTYMVNPFTLGQMFAVFSI